MKIFKPKIVCVGADSVLQQSVSEDVPSVPGRISEVAGHGPRVQAKKGKRSRTGEYSLYCYEPISGSGAVALIGRCF